MTNKLEPPADLYDTPYDPSLRGKWRSLISFGLLYIRVIGPGNRPGTVEAEQIGKPGNYQDDLPVQTLLRHYEQLVDRGD